MAREEIKEPIQWYTCELTEDVGCGKSLDERNPVGCAKCSIYQRLGASNEKCMSHQGEQLKKEDCWSCKSKKEQEEILKRIFKKR